MADPTTTGLSPLDQIRLVEAEVARKIVAARQATEHKIINTHMQATLLKKQAQDSGNREGQIHYKGIVIKAEEEARSMVSHAHNQAADLQRRGLVRMDAAVQEVVNIVLALKGGENK